MPSKPAVPSAPLTVTDLRRLIEEVRELSSDDYQRKAVTLRGSLTSTVSSVQDTYRPPNTHKCVIMGVRAHIVIVTPASETEPMTGMATAHVLNRLAFKASNCRVTLTNNDTQEKLLGENRALALSTLLEAAGGRPLDWSKMPHILTPGQTLQAEMTLVTTGTNAFVGAETEYGVTLDVALIRVRGG